MANHHSEHYYYYYYYYRKKRFRWRNVKRLQGHLTNAVTAVMILSFQITVQTYLQLISMLKLAVRSKKNFLADMDFL